MAMVEENSDNSKNSKKRQGRTSEMCAYSNLSQGAGIKKRFEYFPKYSKSRSSIYYKKHMQCLQTSSMESVHYIELKLGINNLNLCISMNVVFTKDYANTG